MKTGVLKFGGTSVGNIERIKKVASIISTYKKKNIGVIVVSSAMSGTTNDLIKKSRKLSNSFELSLIKKSIFSTFSTISIFKITSNFILVFNFYGDATL